MQNQDPAYGSVVPPQSIFQSEKELRQTTLFDEQDTFSKKRISLHKVAIHDPGTQNVSRYQYNMVIIDLCMTINIELSENAIINLIQSFKK